MSPNKSLKILIPASLVGVGVGLGVMGVQLREPRAVTMPSAASVAQAASAPVSGPVDANIFVNLAKKVVPSVVNISTLSIAKGPQGRGGTQEDLFRRFFEDFFRQHGGPRGGMPDGGPEDEEGPTPGPAPKRPRNMPRAMSLGTGFIIDSSGLILTNNHVVAGADEIKIHFTEEADEKPTDGEVVGRDPELDLALIRVKSKRVMIPIALGDSDAIEVGEYVIAVGNPFGQGHSVTHGIISAKDRRTEGLLGNYLQTDAPINPGNSGGPLVNLRGEVIAINNAIDQRAQGIGFAIPINLVKKVLPQLKTKGTVARGYIGVLVNEMTPEVAGKFNLPKDVKAPFVTHVYPGEPADKAGIRPYDVIKEFNGKPIRTPADLISEVTSVPVNESAKLKVIRDGKEKDLSIRVAQRPGAPKAEKKEPEKKREKRPAQVDVGMELKDLDANLAEDLGLKRGFRGVVVTGIDYGGPADEAGILRGDIVLEVDRQPVKSTDEFYKLVKTKKSYLLRVRRADPQDRELFAVVVLDLKGK